MTQANYSEQPWSLQAYWGETSHAGASLTRKQLSSWQPIRLPADADLLPDLPALVGRARDLNRNNGIAAGGLQTLQDNVAGYGLRLAAAPDYRALGQTIEWSEEWCRNVESLWKTWSETTACDAAGELNFGQLTQLIFRSAVENGEALALPLWLDRPDTPFRTCLQLVESDRLSNPNNEPNRMGLIGGIEKDDYGRPIAYWIRHAPLWIGGWFLIGSAAEWKWDRIPAMTSWGRKRVLHVHQKERIGQSRGRPLLTPVIEQFRMLDAYTRTELQSAIVNALVAGVLETPLDPNAILAMMGGDANSYLQMKNEYKVRLDGGTIIPLYPGDKLTPFIPARPAPQFTQFIESLARQIGTSMGLPYELALKDFSKTNYSSARAALLEAWRFFTIRRKWLLDNWASPVYRLWLEEAVQTGQIEAPGYADNKEYYCRAKWIGMGRGWVDPVKEAQAAQLRMQAMISTLEMECAEQGLDWNEVLEQRAVEDSRIKQLGLSMPLISIASGKQTPDEPVADEPATNQTPQSEAA